MGSFIPAVRIKAMAGGCAMRIVRWLDRALPPAGLRLMLWPVAAVATAAEWCRRGSRLRLQRDQSELHRVLDTRRWWSGRLAYHLGRFLNFLPDRFSSPRWKARCRLVGLTEEDQTALAAKPVVLVTFHFGPIYQLRYWLRAFGFKATVLVDEPAGERSELKLAKDRLSDVGTGIGNVPHVYSRGELRQAFRALESGGMMVVAVDHLVGREVTVNVDGLKIRLATGAARLAESTGAVLLPCVMMETAPWKFTLHFGRPVSQDAAGGVVDNEAALRHILGEMLPLMRAHPEQCSEELLACVSGAKSQPAACAGTAVRPAWQRISP